MFPVVSVAGAAQQCVSRNGAMSSIFLKVFDVFREKLKSETARRRECLEALFAFCSEFEAACSQFFLARERDKGGPRSDTTVSTFINLQKLDGTAQRLQLLARTAFLETDVPLHVFELLRRMAQAKQFLIIAENPYILEGFMADLDWVKVQAGRTITAAAREAGYDLTDPNLPFIIGFNAASELSSKDDDFNATAPSAQIMYRYSLKVARKKWEDAGHKWDDAWDKADPFE